MVVDTSALVAIVLREPLRARLLDAIDSAETRIISSVSLLEAGMVLRARSGDGAVSVLHQLIGEFGAQIAAFDEAQAKLAIAAFARFGKGLGHRAQLNFGDCAVDALAALNGEPILATGRDFAATDVTVLRP